VANVSEQLTRPAADRGRNEHASPQLPDWSLDAEVGLIGDECSAAARRLLRENGDRLDGIAALLLERKRLDEPAVYAAGVSPAIDECRCR
jgi:cell division protease FtsH